MNTAMIFQRYELKYMLTAVQKQKLMRLMRDKMQLDDYGRSSIRNIYYDTRDFRLVRRSIEKPVYKEKLRVRSYGSVGADGVVFVELKKKFESVVYKRRIAATETQARRWLAGLEAAPEDAQIAREIDYFRQFYRSLRPMVYLSYDREAYYSTIGEDLRLTLDENILWRDTALSLTEEPGGRRVIPAGSTLMELKTGTAIPLWLARFLSEERIAKISFSKYGEAYRQKITGDVLGEPARVA